MSRLTIHDLDPASWQDLRDRAAARGRTPEEEARALLTRALAEATSDPWGPVNRIRERLAASGRTFADSAESVQEDRGR